MQKIKYTIRISIMVAIGIFSSQAALAFDYSSYTYLLVTTGLTSKEVINHNINVYNDILTSVERKVISKKTYHIDRKKFVITKINDLEKRMNNQLGMASNLISPIMFAELNTAFYKVKIAANEYNYSAILQLTKAARQELESAKIN